MWDPYAEFESEILPNGLTVYASYWPNRPWEAMGFLVHSGAEHDPAGLEGLSHFVEHLVPNNTNLSIKEIYAFFEDCGGEVNLGTTTYPATYYRFFVPADKKILARAFSIFGHMLLLDKIERFIERERQVIVNEFHRRYPARFKFDLAIHEHKVLYAGYNLERQICPIGSPESIERITQSELQSHYDKHYTPANISVVAVGGVRLTELVKLLSESPFAITKRGSRMPLPTPETNITPPLENHYVFKFSKYIIAPIEAGTYRSVAKIPGNINEQIVFLVKEMLNEILNEEIRERRAWTYNIKTSVFNFRKFYEFTIECDAFELNALHKIEEVIEVCIASIGNQEDLFNQVKSRSLARNSIIDLTGRGVCRSALEDLAEKQRIVPIKEISRDIKRATMSDVRNLLQWLRPEQRWTLIVRP